MRSNVGAVSGFITIFSVAGILLIGGFGWLIPMSRGSIPMAHALAAPPALTQIAATPTVHLVVRAREKGKFFAAALAEKARQVRGVARVERVLLVAAKPHDILGVDPDGSLRIPIDRSLANVTVDEGRHFKPGDAGKRVAIVGRGTAVEDYRPGADGMTRMRHRFDIGSSFALRDSTARLRVIGIYAGASEDKVFLPLTTAQTLLKQEGKLSHLLVAVASGSDPAQVARALQAALGADVEVTAVR